MKRIKTLFLCLSVSGCAVDLGLGVHPLSLDAPEVKLENPVFILEAEKDYGRLKGFCAHHSAVFHRENGLGYNLCGVKLRI